MIVLAYVIIWLVLLLCIAMVLTAAMHLWTGVPYVPTPRKAAAEMIRMAAMEGRETVVDLGAGDGRLLIMAKKRHPGVTAAGCEFVPTIWLLGKLTILLSRQDVRLELEDAMAFDVSKADVVFLYLMPHFMRNLEPKFDKELKPGTVVISRTFKFPNKPILETREAPGVMGSKLYLYRW